jgi:bifunctional UDP-N-acetylglucosamine pyrophosphorylase/glucosamine-1-phosphate N-acetyltransferase
MTAPRDATAVILAAGLGTRMKSTRPKAMHKIAGRPMLAHLIAACENLFARIVVVVGPDMPELAAVADPHPVVVQAERLGTGHAALQAAAQFGGGDVAVLYADNPLVRPQTLQTLLDRRAAPGIGLALLAMRPPEPGRYGRVIGSGGLVERIVEYADATEAERAEALCNAGVLCAPAADMAAWLAALRNDNAQREYYLTDVVSLARQAHRAVAAVEAPYAELRGINSRAELAQAEAEVQVRLRVAAMEGGATLTAPETVFFAFDTALAPDVEIEPHVVFGPGVSVAAGARIRAFSHLEGCAVAEGATVGPFARLRPATTVGAGAHVGNFCELKAVDLGAGAKVNHLTYLGDAAVGQRTNVGAGTITCNYDGFAKHRTSIGDDVFVGSDAVLVAPLTVGDGALIAAGSVVTRDVEADAMVFGRARQEDKPGRAASFRDAHRKR